MKKYLVFIVIVFSIFLLLSVVILFIDEPGLGRINPTLSEKLSSISILLTLAIAVVGFPSGYKIYTDIVKTRLKAFLAISLSIPKKFRNGQIDLKKDDQGYICTLTRNYNKTAQTYNRYGEGQGDTFDFSINLKNITPTIIDSFMLFLYVEKGFPFDVNFCGSESFEEINNHLVFQYSHKGRTIDEDEIFVPPDHLTLKLLNNKRVRKKSFKAYFKVREEKLKESELRIIFRIKETVSTIPK